MKFGKSLVLGLAVVSGLAVSTQVSASKVQAYNNPKSSQYMKTVKQYKFIDDNYGDYIRDFKYGMIEKLFNLFGALIIDKDGITIYDDYVE